MTDMITTHPAEPGRSRGVGLKLAWLRDACRRDMRMAIRRAQPSNAGFTLLEIAGALTIIAILAAIITAAVVRRIDFAAGAREKTELETIAGAYVQSALRARAIAGTDTWASAVASTLASPLDRITRTARGSARAFLVDPNLTIGGGLPYAQTNLGAARPASARVMFVSSTTPKALPVGSAAISAADFNAIWNAAEGSLPAGSTWAGWGRGDDLRIQRLNLEPFFHRVILIDRDPDGPGIFSVDSTNTLTVPVGGMGWSAYYLDGSVVGLHDSNNVVMTRHMVKQDISFIFEHNAWRGQVTGRIYGSSMASGFEAQAADFFNAAWNPRSGQGSSQISVMVAMYTFMLDYTLWANECPHFAHHGYTNGNVTSLPEYDLLNAVGQNNGFLDKYSDENTGLLKAK